MGFAPAVPELSSSLLPVYGLTALAVAISAIAQVGQTNQDTVAFIFRSGLYKLPGVSQQTLPEVPPAYNFSNLKKSLERSRMASPKLQQAIFDACTEIVLMSKKVNLQQADLLRAIAIVLKCSLPPFLSRNP